MEMKYGDDDTQLHEEQQQQQQRQRFHVLAVDDSLVDRKVLERLLRVSSYQVTCVDSGNKALEYLGLLDDLDNASSLMPPSSSSPSAQSLQQQGAKVNLIMTDYCMPGMSGYDLLKRLKGSSWKDVPVVVMSSENIPSRITKCLEGGAEEFLLKPLQITDVEKLQPHLLKSLRDQPYTCKTLAGNDDGNNKNNNNSNSNNASKRKAMSPEPSERRSKMKQLAVV